METEKDKVLANLEAIKQARKTQFELYKKYIAEHATNKHQHTATNPFREAMMKRIEAAREAALAKKEAAKVSQIVEEPVKKTTKKSTKKSTKKTTDAEK